MKSIASIALAAASFFLAACATPTTGMRMVDSGPAPTEAQAQAAVMNYLRATLKDPDSLKQFKMLGSPQVVTWYRGLIYGGGNEEAWLQCFEYNAKNSYGGYVGLKVDGVALRVYGSTADVITGVNWTLADRHC